MDQQFKQNNNSSGYKVKWVQICRAKKIFETLHPDKKVALSWFKGVCSHWILSTKGRRLKWKCWFQYAKRFLMEIWPFSKGIKGPQTPETKPVVSLKIERVLDNSQKRFPVLPLLAAQFAQRNNGRCSYFKWMLIMGCLLAVRLWLILSGTFSIHQQLNVYLLHSSITKAVVSFFKGVLRFYLISSLLCRWETVGIEAKFPSVPQILRSASELWGGGSPPVTRALISDDGSRWLIPNTGILE